MPPDQNAGPANVAAPPVHEDLMAYLEAFLSPPSPRLLLIRGPRGSGKSSLITALNRALKGPRVLVVYRSKRPQEASGSGPANWSSAMSFVLVDSGGEAASDPFSVGAKAALSAPGKLVAPGDDDSIPRPIIDAVERLLAKGGGYLLVDSWDQASEDSLLEHDTGAGPVMATGSVRGLRERMGKSPIRMVIAMRTEPQPGLEEVSDGIVELGWEEPENCRLRVASIPWIVGKPLPDAHFIYSLQDGRFYCPPRLRPDFRAPVGPPAPDPSPVQGSQWPGSAAYADAFGRLRDNSLTAFEMSPFLPPRMMDVMALPAAAQTLLSGGRVLWIPSPQSTPGILCEELLRFVPRDWVLERMRILSASGPDRTLGDLQGIIMTVRIEVGTGNDLRAATAVPVAPAFPDARRFLHDAVEGTPTLFVLSWDGLRAVAAVGGVTYRVPLFPLILGAYERLSHFHGLGFGRNDDPLSAAAFSSVATHLKMEQKHGRTVIWGVRPQTPAYMLDWSDPEGRYALLPVS
jgi:energy-coupling factor transporter ATP-binding protein EcfA2